jgi:predicted nuclease of predicted toxin-antitoxin system
VRFLANENFPGDAVAALRVGGHDVARVRTDSPGSTDRDVLARAAREGRILVTFDKDFGDLARRTALPPTSGVVLLRLPMPAAAKAGTELARLLASRNDWAGHFSVVEPARVRMRPLAATE